MVRLTAAQRDELLLELVQNQRILTEFARHVQSGIEGMRKNPFTKMLPGMTGAMEAFGKVQFPPIRFHEAQPAPEHVAQPEPEEGDGEAQPAPEHIAQPEPEPAVEPSESDGDEPETEGEGIPSEDAPVPRKDQGDAKDHVVVRFPVAG